MREVKIIGVGMTHFGKFLERSMKDLSREACLTGADRIIVATQVIEAWCRTSTKPPASPWSTFATCPTLWSAYRLLSKNPENGLCVPTWST